MECHRSSSRMVSGDPRPTSSHSRLEHAAKGERQGERTPSTRTTGSSRSRAMASRSTSACSSAGGCPRPPYDQVWAGASSNIVRLQSAIAALGEDDNVERIALDAALKKAQAQAIVPPVTEQIAQTEKFIERAK